MISLRDSYCGTLAGVLAGDALGAPYENQRAAAIQEDFIRRGGLVPFDYLDPWEGERQIQRGQPTDDSELTACLALSLAQFPMFEAIDIYHRLRSFIHGRWSVLTDGPAYGSGGTLRAALRPASYDESLLAFKRGEVPVVPSNGSLMRCSPVALCCYGNLDETIEFAWRQSCITHVHPSAQAACVVYSVLLSQLLAGVTPSVAWHKTQGILFDHAYARTNEMVRPLLEINIYQPREDEIWPQTGSVVLSLRIALWALLSSTSFRDGITKAVSVGGDTDTYAAIAGGLLGATYGTGGIPSGWKDAMTGQGYEKMLNIASRLLVTRMDLLR